jgi:predicted house-cleaning noncanonical NTP pyrophosphatase (MazG superfamily)
MSKIAYNKLVRDKIPQIIAASGKIAQTSILDDHNYAGALKNKMVEEARELMEAQSRADVLNELADLDELIRATADYHGISAAELQQACLHKVAERGAFKNKIFLHQVEE